jgi:hydroxymethylpyrimidine/phosphomethylpyrimidine kinase
VYGTSAITLLTVQNTRGVEQVRVLDPELVLAQIDAVVTDLRPSAAKTGALGSAAIVRAVARRASRFEFPLVVDPVLLSKHGAPLLDEEGRRALVEQLLPHASLVTPNLPEAAALSRMEIADETSLREAARRIAALGARAVLIKGGHGSSAEAADLLLAGGDFHVFSEKRIATDQTHGTGCTLSAAITAQLARGRSLLEAVAAAKRYITRAIRTRPELGHGVGPVNHRAEVD